MILRMPQFLSHLKLLIFGIIAPILFLPTIVLYYVFVDNYMVVRYEDIALEPYKQSQEIFKFLDIEMDNDIIR